MTDYKSPSKPRKQVYFQKSSSKRSSFFLFCPWCALCFVAFVGCFVVNENKAPGFSVLISLILFKFLLWLLIWFELFTGWAEGAPMEIFTCLGLSQELKLSVCFTEWISTIDSRAEVPHSVMGFSGSWATVWIWGFGFLKMFFFCFTWTKINQNWNKLITL